MKRMMMMIVKSSQVAMGRRPQLSVYGSDWDTEDGTGFVLVFLLMLLFVFLLVFAFGTSSCW